MPENTPENELLIKRQQIQEQVRAADKARPKARNAGRHAGRRQAISGAALLQA